MNTGNHITAPRREPLQPTRGIAEWRNGSFFLISSFTLSGVRPSATVICRGHLSGNVGAVRRRIRSLLSSTLQLLECLRGSPGDMQNQNLGKSNAYRYWMDPLKKFKALKELWPTSGMQQPISVNE